MKNHLKILFVFVLVSCAGSSFADGPGWTAWSDVKQLIVTSSGGINVRLSPDLSGCVSQGGYGPLYASIYPNHPGINLLQSNLLAAYVSGKKVQIYLSDNQCKVAEMRLE